MSVTIQPRGDSAANWTATNPVLHQRELGIETDTGNVKIGDGATAWNSLPYAFTLAGAALPTMTQVAASASAALAVNRLTTVTAATLLTMTLPTSVTGALIVVERAAASAANVAVTGNIRGVGAQTVTLQLASESEMFLGYSGSWWPIAGHKTLSSLNALYDATGAASAAQTGAQNYADANKLAKAQNLADVASLPAALNSLTGASYPDQLPSVQAALLGAAGLTTLYAAIANRESAAAIILGLGDSIEFGTGAATWLGTWIQQANVKIRQMYPTAAGLANIVAGNPAGGQGFIPVVPTTGSPTYTSPFTIAGGAGTVEDVGPVRNALLLANGSTSCQWTAPAGTTHVQLAYFNQGGTIGWQINSGSVTNIVTSSAHTDSLSALIAITSGQVLKVTGVSGPCIFSGIIHYAGDETSGVSLYNLGHSGWKCSDWTAAETNGYNWAQVLAVLNPAAILIGLGGNDAQAVNAATFGANLQTLVTLIRAQSGLGTVPIIFHTTYAGNATIIDSGGWPAYVAQIRAVAAANLYTKVIDTSARWPSYASDFAGDSLYYTAGGSGGVGVHPSPLGHTLFAEIITRGLTIG